MAPASGEARNAGWRGRVGLATTSARASRTQSSIMARLERGRWRETPPRKRPGSPAAAARNRSADRRLSVPVAGRRGRSRTWICLRGFGAPAGWGHEPAAGGAGVRDRSADGGENAGHFGAAGPSAQPAARCARSSTASPARSTKSGRTPRVGASSGTRGGGSSGGPRPGFAPGKPKAGPNSREQTKDLLELRGRYQRGCCERAALSRRMARRAEWRGSSRHGLRSKSRSVLGIGAAFTPATRGGLDSNTCTSFENEPWPGKMTGVFSKRIETARLGPTAGCRCAPPGPPRRQHRPGCPCSVWACRPRRARGYPAGDAATNR
jgi:hypothetical protein